MTYTQLPALNVPGDNRGVINADSIFDPARNYNFFVAKCSLAPQDQQIIYLPVSVNFHPISLIVSSTTNLMCEISGDSQRNILADTGLFTTITLSAEYTVFDSPIAAIRLTNTDSTLSDAAILVTVTQ